MIKLQSNRRGFTLVELLLVLGILAILAGVIAGGIMSAKAGKCTALGAALARVVNKCDSAIAGSEEVGAVASCLSEAQKAINEWCEADCGGISASTSTVITTINNRIPAYRESLPDAEGAKISLLTKPC